MGHLRLGVDGPRGGDVLGGAGQRVEAVDRTGAEGGVLVPVEATDLVRAVVGAVAGADAAVVDLEVHALVAVHRGVGRADDFAGSIVAVLTHDRLLDNVHIETVGSAVITMDGDPVHLAVLAHLVAADHGNVVLAGAGHYAGVAARAGVEIHRHAPLGAGVGGAGVPQVQAAAGLAVGAVEPRLVAVLVLLGADGHFLGDLFAAIQAVMPLDVGQQVGGASLGDGHLADTAKHDSIHHQALTNGQFGHGARVLAAPTEERLEGSGMLTILTWIGRRSLAAPAPISTTSPSFQPSRSASAGDTAR